MQTDSYSQNVPYPTQLDKPNAQTLGGGIVENMIHRTVMRFPSAAVRGAVISAPVAGMTTWLTDVARLEVYDGSVWAAVAAAQSIWTRIPLMDGYHDDDPSTSTGNNDQGQVAYRVVDLFGERALMLRGGMHIDYQSNGYPYFSGDFMAEVFPPTIRPAHRRTVPVAVSTTDSDVHTVKLDINTDGTMRLIGLGGASNNPPWVSLNGVLCSL